jgi:DNA-binding NarL/FixJ family response regulator
MSGDHGWTDHQHAPRQARLPTQPRALPPPQHQAQVALLGLPPVYRRGLGLGLSEAGYDVQHPTDLSAWACAAPGAKVALATDSEATLDLLDRVHGECPDLVSVVLVERGDVTGYSRALPRCTAAIPLHAELDDVLTAIRAAENGFTLLPVDIARELTAQTDAAPTPPQLSDRELTWLRALADNGTVLSLARASGYSEREMYRLLSAMYERLGTTTRTSALLQADRLGLLRGAVPDQPTAEAVAGPRRRGQG